MTVGEKRGVHLREVLVHLLLLRGERLGSFKSQTRDPAERVREADRQERGKMKLPESRKTQSTWRLPLHKKKDASSL